MLTAWHSGYNTRCHHGTHWSGRTHRSEHHTQLLASLQLAGDYQWWSMACSHQEPRQWTRASAWRQGSQDSPLCPASNDITLIVSLHKVLLYWLTLKGSPSNFISIFPLKTPSGISMWYLLHGPLVGRTVRSAQKTHHSQLYSTDSIILPSVISLIYPFIFSRHSWMS